ncbi:hypothetical protein [Vitreimonas sp.]|uniref:hypothetical protein n=1 Tax=Vitreimonas sp. TaxID=3069702 RepID=UPI002D790432|nr:hypothetical protein [Vitreimonas sp.]
MLNYDVFEAFKSAGADDEKARKAAEALARADGHFDERFDRISDRFLKVDERFMRIEAKLDLHSWMIGAVVAMNIAILVRLLIPV